MEDCSEELNDQFKHLFSLTNEEKEKLENDENADSKTLEIESIWIKLKKSQYKEIENIMKIVVKIEEVYKINQFQLLIEGIFCIEI